MAHSWNAIRKRAARGLRALLAGAIFTHAGAARAQEAAFIRDAEIEQLLRDYVNPIFRAAGINSKAAQVILINDRSFNAFVANGQKIFVNTGALMDAKTPNEMIGVLAHESGHIAGGHLARQHQELATAQILSIAGLLVSAGAIAAQTYATTRSRTAAVGTDGAAVGGVLLGPQELIQRSLLSYQRGEEQAADRAALKYLNATGQSSKGMITTFERFANDSLFTHANVDRYLLSHPMPTERISNLQQTAKESPYFETTDPPALQARHDLVRAKLYGFISDQGEITRRYSDNSLPARYARAIGDYRFGRLERSLSEIDGLIASQPNNPYFYELKGQVLLESGRPEEAIAPLRKALSMTQSAYPIRVLYGHALVSGAPSHTDEAIRVLSQAAQNDSDSGEAYRYLAMAYDRKGDSANAQLAAAQALFQSGDYIEARTQATRAQSQFKQGSPGWLRADDILNYRPSE